MVRKVVVHLFCLTLLKFNEDEDEDENGVCKEDSFHFSLNHLLTLSWSFVSSVGDETLSTLNMSDGNGSQLWVW